MRDGTKQLWPCDIAELRLRPKLCQIGGWRGKARFVAQMLLVTAIGALAPVATADEPKAPNALSAAALQTTPIADQGYLASLAEGLRATSPMSESSSVTEEVDSLVLDGGTCGAESSHCGFDAFGRGDMYPDGSPTARDITWFAIALRDQDYYSFKWGRDPVIHGDMNRDLSFDFDDIEPFWNMISCEVPEPTSLVLFAWIMSLIIRAGARSRGCSRLAARTDISNQVVSR
jgi:hypothetical protein